MGMRQKASESTVLDDVSSKKLLEADFIDLRLEPLFGVFVEHMRAGGLDAEELQTAEDKVIRWNFRYGGKISVCCGIYVDGHGDVVNFLDMAVARIASKEKGDAVKAKLNELNAFVPVPVRYRVDDEHMTVKVSYIVETQFTSAEVLKNILEVAKPLSLGLLEIMEQEFGLKPFFNDDDKEAA